MREYRARQKLEREKNKKVTETLLADAKKRNESDNTQNYLPLTTASTQSIFTFNDKILNEKDLGKISHKRNWENKSK